MCEGTWVFARSSSQRKDMFLAAQDILGEKALLQLLIDMKVRWSSTYIMLCRAESRMESVNRFVSDMSKKEKNLDKKKKIDAMELSEEEWTRVGLFCNLLGYADDAQQAFSADKLPTLYNALPAIEKMYSSWEKALNKEKYAAFVPALQEGMSKLNEYYEKTAASDAHIMAMLLHPEQKLGYFKKNWEASLVEKVKELALNKLEERYKHIHASGTSSNVASSASQNSRRVKKRSGVSRRVMDTDSEDEDEVDPLSDPSKPWLAEFNRYLMVVESIPKDMNIVEWWGLNAHRYPVWASLARDYLAVMASSVSSERAFSSAGITISKRRNRLKGDIVEALQCLKCMYHEDLIFRDVVTTADVRVELEDMEYSDYGKTTDEAVDDATTFTWDSLVDDDDDDVDVIVIN
ncbi:hypothetical protein HYPSUDRAFT_69968 [Hypholoma sublateritium FD-334 SS-4]|uniref:HAT C-terminal dimerisation domain-containing protein n=2 Tax=Hypholoma sublateritium (strain FD-334 SS-4) TaxID=945553 RepID=A0A0D2NH66_HYPSF|nr:hypothetical protein HYPSUDRAFT_69968 [Hypholoma sublateritium FD-334 SS-4]